MDDQRFDRLARRLGAVLTRRSVLAGLAGLAALRTGLIASNQEAAAKPVKGAVCLRLGKGCKDRRHRCCGNAKCRGGTCRCNSSQRVCQGRCISKTQCCRDGDCGGNGAVCRDRQCRCPQGQRDCDGTCISTDACCGHDDCGACESCVDRQCVSGCQDGQECVAETCRCTTSSCDGCCDGDACRDGDRDGACGSDGEQCFACGDHADCVDGACQCDPGFQDCDGTCIRNNACCDGVCPSGEVCVEGTCETLRCGNGAPCTVFVRAAGVPGNAIGGLDAADALCQASATAMGSQAPAGTYRAWLSDTEEGPAARFTHSPGPYVLVDGTTVVANSWADLTDGTLEVPINRTETGGVAETSVWTNTTQAGLPVEDDGSGSCGEWDQQSGVGRVGHSSQTSRFWTDSGPSSCSDERRLYCFQQD